MHEEPLALFFPFTSYVLRFKAEGLETFSRFAEAGQTISLIVIVIGLLFFLKTLANGVAVGHRRLVPLSRFSETDEACRGQRGHPRLTGLARHVLRFGCEPRGGRGEKPLYTCSVPT